MTPFPIRAVVLPPSTTAKTKSQFLLLSISLPSTAITSMILSWRRKLAGRRAEKKNGNAGDDNSDMEITVPSHFQCPISLDLMKDPVTIATGITYDRDSIEKWIEAGNQTCPVTKQVFSVFDQIPNHSIRRMIQDWCVENKSHGIERIPTPRIPVTPYEVSDTCKRISAASQGGDEKKCKELVGKIKNWGKESERNRRCIVENGAGAVLSAAFESFASGASMEKHGDLMSEILSVLPWMMFPLGAEGQTRLGSMTSLSAVAWILKSGDLSARQNAVLVLKELLSSDPKHVNEAFKIEGIVQELVRSIREPISPTATKASLSTILFMVSAPETDEKIKGAFVEMGLVSLVTEILFNGDKSTSEKALGVMDNLCDSKDGMEMAYQNDLVVPVLIKKMLRVSDLASQFSVSVLWKLCRNEKAREEGGSVVVEALQVGAFQKLLVLLQVGCGETTKGKASELLKLLNIYRAKMDCVDSSLEFKYLKRSY